jgi:hypothetical protein
VGYVIWREPGKAEDWKPVLPEGTNVKVLDTWFSTLGKKEQYGFAGLSSVFNLFSVILSFLS